MDTPGVCILDKPGPAQISNEEDGVNTVLSSHNHISKLPGKKAVFIRMHVCSAITVRCGQWPLAPGSDHHEQNIFNFLSFNNVLKARGLFLFQHSTWKHIILSYLLMQHGSDHSVSFGVSFKHQCVQIWQERVSDVQDIPGIIGKLSIPGNRVLSLLDNIKN